MSDSPDLIYLRRVKRTDGSWTKSWQDLWRSDSGDATYVHLDTAAERIYSHFFGESDTEVPQDLLANIRDILRGEEQ